MHLNNTKHEKDLTKDHDTREIKSYSIIKWSIKDMRGKNGLIYGLSQNIFFCSQNKEMCNHKRKKESLGKRQFNYLFDYKDDVNIYSASCDIFQSVKK